MTTIVHDNAKSHEAGCLGFSHKWIPRLPRLVLPFDLHCFEWREEKDVRRGRTWAQRKQKLAAHIYIEQVAADKAFLDLFHSAEDNARIAQRYVEAVKTEAIR